MANWTIEFYADDTGVEPCRAWMEDDLSTVQYAALMSALRLVLAERGLDVCANHRKTSAVHLRSRARCCVLD